MDLITSYAITKLISGKIKLRKKGPVTILGFIFLFLLFIINVAVFIYGLIDGNINTIAIGLLAAGSVVYICLISTYTQNPNNYYIKVQFENSFEGVELYYKEKKILLKYKIDKEGKFSWADNENKTSCIEYADGSEMKGITRYKIVNYFTQWLLENDYLSKDVKFSEEDTI